MININQFSDLHYSKLAQVSQNLRIFIYFPIAFFIPFLIGHPQILVGTIVNAMLIVSALELNTKKTLPIIFAPSLGVLARGLIFGPFTPFLAIMIPFIWVGNTILVVGIKFLNKKTNYWLALGLATGAKVGFLFSIALTLVSLSILPAMFLIVMGEMQLLTAISGGIVAFGLLKSGATKRLERLIPTS